MAGKKMENGPKTFNLPKSFLHFVQVGSKMTEMKKHVGHLVNNSCEMKKRFASKAAKMYNMFLHFVSKAAKLCGVKKHFGLIEDFWGKYEDRCW